MPEQLKHPTPKRHHRAYPYFSPITYNAQMRVGDTPSIFYVPDFISEAEEQEILTRTYARDVDADASDEWVSLRSRRLKCWGGQPGESFRPEPLPPWVGALCDLLVVRKVFAEEDRPNHVLLNGEKRGGLGGEKENVWYEEKKIGVKFYVQQSDEYDGTLCTAAACRVNRTAVWGLHSEQGSCG